MEVLGRETLREQDGGDHSGQKDEQSKQNARGVVHVTSAVVAAVVTITRILVTTPPAHAGRPAAIHGRSGSEFCPQGIA